MEILHFSRYQMTIMSTEETMLFPPLPDSDAGSDGEASGEGHNNKQTEHRRQCGVTAIP
ncbi:hypothetical protein LX32DRAFT_634016 [Colletotrichum zoysiae]|uniref:Uncharacterized protein n=1 Tax=Colletotrichum zoysiae TaxID=1216348 RepID=A0AAD9M778_9PEZI|nr:hypothetical protein LX32DRAFT_634016 [Colletotrichum zoysiae]